MASRISDTLTVPISLFEGKVPSGFGMDIGGSLLKVAYAKRDGDVMHINFLAYPKERMQEALDDLKSKLTGIVEPGAVVYTTGMGCNQYGRYINEAFDVRIKNGIEMDCLVAAVTFFKTKLPLSESAFVPTGHTHDYIRAEVAAFNSLFEAATDSEGSAGGFGTCAAAEDVFPAPVPSGVPNNNDAGKADDVTSSMTSSIQFPAVMCCIGSGVVCVTVNEDGSSEFISATSQGGRMLMGLGSLLTGAKGFHEMVAMAARGDAGQVETKCKHQKSDDVTDIYSMLPDEKPMYCFGNAVGKRIDDFKKEDLAAAVLSQMAQSVAQICHQGLVSSSANTLLFTGSVCSESEFIRDELTKFFAVNLSSRPTAEKSTYYFLKHGAYMGALGALLIGSKS